MGRGYPGTCPNWNSTQRDVQMLDTITDTVVFLQTGALANCSMRGPTGRLMRQWYINTYNQCTEIMNTCGSIRKRLEEAEGASNCLAPSQTWCCSFSGMHLALMTMELNLWICNLAPNKYVPLKLLPLSWHVFTAKETLNGNNIHFTELLWMMGSFNHRENNCDYTVTK